MSSVASSFWFGNSYSGSVWIWGIIQPSLERLPASHLRISLFRWKTQIRSCYCQISIRAALSGSGSSRGSSIYRYPPIGRTLASSNAVISPALRHLARSFREAAFFCSQKLYASTPSINRKGGSAHSTTPIMASAALCGSPGCCPLLP
jgi:hypothetical protein